MQSDATKVILGAILVFGTIFLYTLEFPYFQNTLNLQRLLISAVLGGLIFGGIFGFIFGKDRKELIERFQIFIGVTVLTILIMPLLLSRFNRSLSTKTSPEQMEIIRVETYAGSRFGQLEELQGNPDGFRVFLNRNGEVIRLQKDTTPFSGNKEGDRVGVPVTRGLLGFEFVKWE